MEKLKPKLFSVMKTYTKEQFVKDVVAGIIVAIIALPLSIALALASGVGPEQGIYTAIVAGFLISFFGGSRVQIAGPTAAFATIVAGIVAQHGMDGLVAQGIGNIGSALFGGIPATGAIARTAANVKNGGRTPIAGMVHSVTLLLVLVVLMPYAGLIPMPAIAAILFMVAYNMCQWRPFVHLVKHAPKSDIVVLVTTFALTVLFDLVVAIEIGMILACLLFMKRMSDETDIHSWKYLDDDDDPDSLSLRKVSKHVRVYEISGPLFFGAADQLLDISAKDYTKVLILRMRSVTALDATAINALENLYEKCVNRGITLMFSHVNEQPMHSLQKDGFVELVGEENFCSHIDEALARAEALYPEENQ